jgi:hypothetical protein
MTKKKKPEPEQPEVPTEVVPPLPPRTKDQFRLALRRKTRLFYDIQRMRMQAEGRLTKKSPTNPIELHPTDLARLGARVKDLAVAEKNALNDLDDHLMEVPFYREVILPERKGQFKGWGPRMASILLSSFDIEREETVSQMWSFAGLAPKRALRCKLCHEVMVGLEDPIRHPKPAGNKCEFAGGPIPVALTYESGKSAKPEKGEKLTYNAWLRTKLMGVFADVLMKCGSPFRSFYDNYKQRLISSGKGKNDGHRHWMSKRYMIKMLLLDLHKRWRTFEGLSLRGTYQEEYLQHTHHVTPKLAAPPPVHHDDDRDEFTDKEVAEALADET